MNMEALSAMMMSLNNGDLTSEAKDKLCINCTFVSLQLQQEMLQQLRDLRGQIDWMYHQMNTANSGTGADTNAAPVETAPNA